jgi:hypothetical protein
MKKLILILVVLMLVVLLCAALFKYCQGYFSMAS